MKIVLWAMMEMGLLDDGDGTTRLWRWDNSMMEMGLLDDGDGTTR